MRILALDTSTQMQTVALVADGSVLAEHEQPVSRGHTSTLLASVDRCLSHAGLSLDDLQLIATGLGPGSFTGLRIGVACAKTLGFARGLPVVGVSSLAAMAFGRAVPEGALVATANDARKGELYAAVWELGADGEPSAVVPPAALLPGALAAQLEALPRPAVGLGNGFALYSDVLHGRLGSGLDVWPEELGRPRATAVAELGRRRFAREGGAELVALEPVYLRQSDAELNWRLPSTGPLR
jgi:tRNA threonylcarbamoyladenosine biosynthesis protein TsaB